MRSSGVRGVGVSTQTRPSKRSARACAAPRRSEPASGWAPTNDRGRARVPLDGLDDLPLRAAGVGDQHVRRRGQRRATHVVGDPIDRRADNHEIGFGDAGVEVGRAAIDGAEPGGLVERRLVATDADHLRREPPRAQRQPDRSADQPDADDRHGPETLHSHFLAAKPGKTPRTSKRIDLNSETDQIPDRDSNISPSLFATTRLLLTRS